MCAWPVDGIGHLFNVTVIGGDQAMAAHAGQRVDNAADAAIDEFDCLNRGVEVAGVAYHIAVGKIADDQVIVHRL